MNVTSNVSGVFPNTPKLSKSDKAKIAGGSLVAAAAGSAASSSSLVTTFVPTVFEKLGVSADGNKLIREAGEKAIEMTGVKGKGVNINWIPSNGKNYSFIEKIKLMANPLRMHETIEAGLNAGFQPLSNRIIVSKDKNCFTVFHEIGHSINFNNSKFWKGIQKMRMPAMALASLPMLYGAFSKESKAKDGEELTFAQKTNNFIRNNAGKISFATMLPVLAEEGMASIRGCKLANSLLPKGLAKNVAKGNALAYLTYLGSAAGLALGAYVAVKVKDAIVNKTVAKAEARAQDLAQAQAQPEEQESKAEKAAA